MADTLKILGQTALSATANTDVYTVPNAKSATISTITVCNRDSSSCTFRIQVAIAGAVSAAGQYIFYDQFLDAYSTYSITIGITLGATDVIRAYTNGSLVSVNIFGVEVS
jgi:hypothetical protein